MKNTAGFGYAIGMLIVVPLLIWGANYFFYSGNRVSEKQIQQYIENNIIEVFPVNKKDRLDDGYILYRRKLQRRSGGLATYWWRLFYDENYKKYFSLITFGYIHNSDRQRNFIMEDTDNATYKILINKDQLNNPDYGTKDKPIPIWPIELLEYGNTDLSIESRRTKELKERIDLSPEATRLHIGEYLNYFMPKEEYKKMFNK